MSSGEQGFRPIPGSRRKIPPGSRRTGDADPTAPIEVTLVLRRRPDAPSPHEALASGELDLAEFESRLGADPQDVARVERFAHEHGLSITSVNLAARSIGLAGTVAKMNAAFHVELGHYERDGETYRGRVGDVSVPADLAPMISAVLGLDDRRQARAHFRIVGPLSDVGERALTPKAVAASYRPQEVAQRYAFPKDADGTGQTVALIELGGGYQPADLDTYFKNLGLRTPQITAVSVDGANNAPGVDADGEVALDIEVVGAVAQGAAVAVYFAPNTTRGFYDAIAAAMHDRLRTPSVVSISWGGPEETWTEQAMGVYDSLFADAAVLGVTVFCAAGDNGASDGINDGTNHVDFPASSPHVIGCGGTTLTESDETVWNELDSNHGATGGGVSRYFGLPDYQRDARVPPNPDNRPGRGVPDVAGDADPLTGYVVRVDGQDMVIGGTSAVAPLWAGLTTIANQKIGRRVGAPHNAFYNHAASNGAFRDIVTGGIDGGLSAGPGWDPCTGLGSPLGDKLIKVLATG